MTKCGVSFTQLTFGLLNNQKELYYVCIQRSFYDVMLSSSFVAYFYFYLSNILYVYVSRLYFYSSILICVLRYLHTALFSLDGIFCILRALGNSESFCQTIDLMDLKFQKAVSPITITRLPEFISDFLKRQAQSPIISRLLCLHVCEQMSLHTHCVPL